MEDLALSVVLFGFVIGSRVLKLSNGMSFWGALLFGALLLGAPAYAQSTQGPTIIPPSPRSGAAPVPAQRDADRLRPGQALVDEIVVEGTQRIEPETVRSYMAIKEGDPLDGDRVNQSLKGLYATRFVRRRNPATGRWRSLRSGGRKPDHQSDCL